MSDADPPARSPRTSVMLRAFVFRSGRDTPSEHRVANVSATGLGIAQPGDLAVGMTVMAGIGQVDPVPADVVWVRGGQAGLRFHKPIDVARARAKRTGGAAPAPAAGWLGAIDNPYRR